MNMNDFIPVLKDRAIFLGWVAGLVLVSLLLWSLTYSFRADCLMRVTNRILITMDDPEHPSDIKRIISPLPRPLGGKAPLGCWYRMINSDSLFFVFTIMQEGILVPCGAEISAQGEVNIIPLGNHARQIMKRIPHSTIQVYLHRIESAVAASRGNR